MPYKYKLTPEQIKHFSDLLYLWTRHAFTLTDEAIEDLAEKVQFEHKEH